ncbi:MAG: hypothetical protein WCQ00_00545 [bacterium]
MRTKFYFSLFVAFFIITVNYYANFYQVYWLFPWFDIPMHILGGIMVGLFVQTGIEHFNNRKINKNRVLLVFLGAIAVGVFWECVEWYFRITDGLGPLSRIDTIKDVIDDIIGGALSIWFWRFLFNKTKIQQK